VGRERDVHYLNSANFFITRAAFEQIGGFDEQLHTGEDAEIGLRLTLNGHRIRESPRVMAIHHGNPKSVGEFYRRTVWHGLGMFGTITHHRIDKPTAMLGLHLLATMAGLTALVVAPLPLSWRLTILLVLQLVVPALTVLHRMRQTRRFASPFVAVTLYWLYYWARSEALALVLIRRGHLYDK
jgi:hypothetical protein